MAGGDGDGGFHPFQVSASHLAYTILGGFVVLFGMFSLLIKEKLYIGEAPIATVFGIIIGPYVAGIFDPRGWGNKDFDTTNAITLEVTRVVLAIGVFAIGVELPKQYMLKHWKSLFFLLCPIMTYGWFVSAGLIYALIPNLTFLSSLVIAACLTPTDPILAAAVVGGKYAHKHVPAHLRHLLSAESGCNDGAAFPFLFIAIYLILDDSDAHAVGEWFYVTWLYEVLLGIVLGAVLGFAFRHLMKFCERKNLIDRHSYVAQYISLALLSIGMTTLLGSDDLLAAFSCGTAFAWDGWFNRQTEESQFSNVIDLLFNCACFIYIGAWIPFDAFNSVELSLSVWRLVVVALLVMLLRRLPIMIALYRWIPDVKNFREAMFSGHFGPIGVGAVFISTLASTVLPNPHSPPQNQVDILGHSIQPVVAFMVLVSIAIHGLSIPFFSLGRRVHSVSRTWSRHQSHDPSGPEWTQHVRRLPSRREDIVINRDPEAPTVTVTSSEDRMEKGELGSPSGGTLNEKQGSGTRTPTSTTEANGGMEVDTRGETLADPGTPLGEREQEWREGKDLIVESAPTPGGDVRVQVFKNVFDDDGRARDGLEGAIREKVEKMNEEVQKQAAAVAHLLEGKKPTEHATSGSNDESTPLVDDESEWKDEPMTEGERHDSLGSTTSTRAITINEPPHPPHPPHHPHSRRDDRSKSPPRHSHHKSVIKPHVTGGSSRRRDGPRRSLFGKKKHPSKKSGHGHGAEGTDGGAESGSDIGASTAANSVASSPAASSIDLTDPTERGRPTTASSGHHLSQHQTHSRKSSLRPSRSEIGSGYAQGRTSSPASRIRFAGEHAGPTSPRIGTSGLAQSTTPSEVDLPSTAASESRTPVSPSDSNKVAFDLPTKPGSRNGRG
ncbi:hypothetical protein FRC03_004145 [Tulasnella sp. 419]|nr:hypothetical protein FRC03_004145 [Tulasnella sp. 419]